MSEAQSHQSPPKVSTLTLGYTVGQSLHQTSFGGCLCSMNQDVAAEVSDEENILLISPKLK